MSKTRASLYALSVAILALFAYKTKMAQEEIALWEAILALGFVAGTNLLAMVKTWPWQKKAAEVPADE
jgi:hypothetical protein